MSVCMSAVSTGISEVLIKYTGNVWLHIYIMYTMYIIWGPWLGLSMSGVLD